MFYVQSRDGVKLSVYDLNRNAEETVLLIHGWPLSHEIFEYQSNMLVKCGYRVVTMDLRGFGESDAPACGYGYDQMADDIYQVIRAVNLNNFTLVGFSMGGAVVLRYMNRFRGYGVKKLALLAAAAPRFTMTEDFPYGSTEESVNELLRQINADRAQFSQDFSRKLLYSPHSEAVKDWFMGISQKAASIATLQAGEALRDEDGRADLACVHVPTAIFHGTKDEIVPFELGQVQRQCIEHAQLIPFEYSGHGVFYDELDRFNQCFLTFLRQ